MYLLNINHIWTNRQQFGTDKALPRVQEIAIERKRNSFKQKGIRKMTQTKLNLTIFEIEKLRNIVGFGRA